MLVNDILQNKVILHLKSTISIKNYFSLFINRHEQKKKKI